MNKLILAMCTLVSGNAITMDNKSEPWEWFITHCSLSNKTRNIDCSISKFDPVVRIYDADTCELIVALQRLTLEGKNTNLADKGVRIQELRITNPRNPEYLKRLLEVYDTNKKIMSLELDGQQNSIYSFNDNGEKDLEMTVNGPDGFAKLRKFLIRLSPSYIYCTVEKGPDYFFKKLQDEYVASQKNSGNRLN